MYSSFAPLNQACNASARGFRPKHGINFAEQRPAAISIHTICKAAKDIGGRTETHFLTCEAPVSVKVLVIILTSMLPGHRVLPQGRTLALKGGEASTATVDRLLFGTIEMTYSRLSPSVSPILDETIVYLRTPSMLSMIRTSSPTPSIMYCMPKSLRLMVKVVSKPIRKPPHGSLPPPVR